MKSEVTDCRIISGKRNQSGFTLLEMMIVISIIGILYLVAYPRADKVNLKAKETVLKANLKVIRECLDKYYADFGKYPSDLQELVQKRYLREIPIDPITQKRTWKTSSSSPEKEDVYDVHSLSSKTSLEGNSYSDW
jgi:general secretion pathway protein G